MTTAEIMKKMILLSDGNIHDISHFIKVHSYAMLIGSSEGIDSYLLEVLSAAAILHDIACPLCREKYGNTNGKMQEAEGPALVREFFCGTDADEALVKRVEYLVGHHHTIINVDGIDYRILLEADYLVNADEGGYSYENIKNAYNEIFRTQTGRELLSSIYRI